jgi:IS5 family transposase
VSKFRTSSDVDKCSVCQWSPEVVNTWLENPYWQFFTGEAYLQTELPIDPSSLTRWRQHMVEFAQDNGLSLRQNYNCEAPLLASQVGRYAHAKQYKRMGAAIKTLGTRVGRVHRDVRRQLPKLPEQVQAKGQDLLQRVGRILTQKSKDKNKLYALHAPEVECISKGKAGNPYEFGVKVMLATRLKEGLV